VGLPHRAGESGAVRGPGTGDTFGEREIAMRNTGILAAVTMGATTLMMAAVPLTAARAAAAGNDYPYRNDSWHQADPWNFYKRECTSFAAWRLRQRGVPFHNHYKTHWGNANNWDNAARRAGFRVDRRPRAGAVAQWNRGRFGHVAYVARVGRGWVTIEEYNKGGTHRYGTRRVRPGAVENYLHIHRAVARR
jgi:surface antigen